LWSAARPAGCEGVTTALAPLMLRSPCTDGQPNISEAAPSTSGKSIGSIALGETPPKSNASMAAPSPGLTSARPTPPAPLIHGSITPIANPVATAASAALPPALRISAPTVAATRFCETTMPLRER